MVHIIFLGWLGFTSAYVFGHTERLIINAYFSSPPVFESAPKGQLPRDVKPLAYRLDLTLDPRAPTFGGEVAIDIQIHKPLSGFWLHGTGLDVSSIKLDHAARPTRNLSWISSDVEGVNYLASDSEIPKGQYTLIITYSAQFDQNLSGLFSINQPNAAFALAKSESIQARKFLPSFDEPAFKTPYTIALTVPQTMTAISNGKIHATQNQAEGWKRVIFAPTRPLPTYLLSLTVGDFVAVPYADIPPNTIRKTPIAVTGYTQAGKAEQLGFVLSHTSDMVGFYEQTFGLPYPYEKLDIIAAPAWPSGATELAGAITYRESRILLPKNTGEDAKRAALGLHAHELTHMWFGNLVTPDWWEDLWLKEAFATWGTPLALSALFPNEGHSEDAVMSALAAMELDALSSTRAVRTRIMDTKNVRSAYDAITYRKGMAIIAMIDGYFGANVFRPALGAFLSARADSTTNAADFFSFLHIKAKLHKMANIFEVYVNQAGMPLVEVRTSCNESGKTRLNLSQTLYAPLALLAPQVGVTEASTAKIWPIPMCFRALENSRANDIACMVFDTAEAIFETPFACGVGVHPNAEGLGYYRFDLTDANWSDLALSFYVLSTSEALVALDNAIASFEAGTLSADAVKAMLAVAVKHQDRRIFLYPMNALERWLRYAPVPQKPEFIDFALGLYAPVLGRLQNEIPSPERDAALGALSAFNLQLRPDPAVSAQITSLTEAFLSGEAEAAMLRPSEYNAAFVTTLKHKPSNFSLMFSAMKSAPDTRVRLALARAIGEAAPQTDVKTLLDAILVGDINLRETFYILQGLMTNNTHKKAVRFWYEANLEIISARIPSQWRGRLPTLARGYCTEQDAVWLANIFATKSVAAPGHTKALTQTLEHVRNCAARKALIAPRLAALR